MKERENGNVSQPVEFQQQFVRNFDNFAVCIKLNSPHTVRIRQFNISRTEKLSENSKLITTNMSGIEYAFACPNGQIFVYRDCVKSELFSGQKQIDTHDFPIREDEIDIEKIRKIRSVGQSLGKWINIYTSFKKDTANIPKEQISA